MKNWHNTLVTPTTTIRETIGVIDSSAMQIALVTDAEGKLLGTVTDGDIRRTILKGISLETPVADIMHQTPVTVTEDTPEPRILALMQSAQRYRVPVLNAAGCVIDLAVLDDLLQAPLRDNLVVLMAGGLGTRLRPLTEEYPKPLLRVGSKPLLQTIIETFREQGFSNFYLSVNYKADMIKSYFKDGSDFNVNIEYLHETKRLGTAGALTLLPVTTDKPLIVMNGDLLTRVDYRRLINFHSEHQAQASMCVREYQSQIPYGVVQIEHHRMLGIQEKPVQSFFVNAGIYVLEPTALARIPSNEFYDMPTLFEELLQEQAEVAVFPIREYWLDIGQMADFERANLEFAEYFETASA